MSGPEVSAGTRLNELLQAAGFDSLDAETSRRIEIYVALISRWNSRTNLTAVRDCEGILSRHFVESIACARAIPAGVGDLLDFGSGAGFPGLPIALCRPEIAITLAESQGKKAAFLQEAVRALGVPVRVHAGRAEALDAEFDCVTMRAVDRMAAAVSAAAGLVRRDGWLALMITSTQVGEMQGAAGAGFCWKEPLVIPGGTERVIARGSRI